jgi:hypothetical protein
VLFSGAIPFKGANPTYQTGLGNGRYANDIAETGRDGDDNNHRAWLANLTFRPDRLYSLSAGVSVYRDRISLDTGFDETILAVHVAWTQETPEIIAEFANVEHRDSATGATTDSQGYYIQLAYRLPQSRARFKPYARYEELDVDSSDQLFTALSSLDRRLVGLRFDFAELAAIKVEARRDKFENQESIHAGFAQIVLTF